jgi:hypothetical protein
VGPGRSIRHQHPLFPLLHPCRRRRGRPGSRAGPKNGGDGALSRRWCHPGRQSGAAAPGGLVHDDDRATDPGPLPPDPAPPGLDLLRAAMGASAAAATTVGWRRPWGCSPCALGPGHAPTAGSGRAATGGAGRGGGSSQRDSVGSARRRRRQRDGGASDDFLASQRRR